jgi:two-component system, NtrC family, sensor kinase
LRIVAVFGRPDKYSFWRQDRQPREKEGTLPGPIKQRYQLHQQLRQNEQRIRLLEQQIQSVHKLAALGTAACLVAHEFNNILTPMINYAELALKNEDDTALMRKALEKTVKHGNRAALIIQSMLGLVRDQDQQIKSVKLTPLVEECFQCLARDFQKDKINVRLEIPESLEVRVVPSQLQQVILNLIINARQAMLERGGTLAIKAQYPDDLEVEISVSDNGCGIPTEIIDRVFEPFFSTKSDGASDGQKGNGLGLSVCKNIIEAHNGNITVASVPGQQTTFTIRLPRQKT